MRISKIVQPLSSRIFDGITYRQLLLFNNAAQRFVFRTSCVGIKLYGQAERAISSSKLNVLLRLHICPIKLVVFQCSSYLRWEISSWGRFRAYMHSALILTEFRYPAMP